MITDFLLRNKLVPDRLMRSVIRSRLRHTLRKQKKLHADPEHRSRFSDLLRQSAVAINTRDANDQHYEVPAGFFSLVLGPWLKYSCGYWDSDTGSLRESEEKMLELTIERAEIENAQQILDLGCGWGSFSLFAAKKFPDKQFTAVSNSHSQRRFIEKRAEELGIQNLKVITNDVNDFNPSVTFDRVVSVEMFEHVRNYEELFRRIRKWINPGGKLFIHIFNHHTWAYPFDAEKKSEWMARHFFSGGIMPSDDLLFDFSNGFTKEGHWVINGRHYSRTLETWLMNMDRNRREVMQIFRNTYGRDADKFMAYWRIFFMACSETFAMNEGREWQVSHYLFRKDRSSG